jgi:cytochrome P450
MLTRGVPLDRTDPMAPPDELSTIAQGKAVHRMAYFQEGEGWLVTSWELARAVLADRRFSAAAPTTYSPVDTGSGGAGAHPGRALPGMFIRMDPPDHTRLRGKLTGAFTKRRIDALAPAVIRAVDGAIDTLDAMGPPADLVEHFALPVPSLVISEMLGVPPAHRADFQHDAAMLFDHDATPMRRGRAYNRIELLLRRLTAAKRADPGNDLLSNLAVDDDLTVNEAAGMGALLLVAGHETTANMLGLGTYALLRHPEALARFRSAADGGANAVEELLRRLSIVQVGLTRVATEDMEIGGELVRSGELVTVSLVAANHDPAAIERPEALDLDRDPGGGLAFGHGLHKCIGQHLARLELRIGLERLVQRLDGLALAVDPGEIRFKTRAVHYGVAALPVQWNGRAG